VSPHKTKKGANSYPLKPRHEWDPKPWQILSPRGWAKGVQGAKPPRGNWNYNTAMASISTRAPLGNAATCTVVLAGGDCGKNSA